MKREQLWMLRYMGGIQIQQFLQGYNYKMNKHADHKVWYPNYKYEYERKLQFWVVAIRLLLVLAELQVENSTTKLVWNA